MIAPKEGRRSEWLSRAENVACGSLALTLRHNPMLNAYVTRARIGPTRDVAGGKNPRNTRFQEFIDQHAIVGRDPCFFSKRSVRAHTDSYDNEVGVQNRPIIELHISFSNCGRHSSEM